MNRIPEGIRRQFALSAQEEVVFTQLTAEPFHYRDAVRFHNGRHLLLQSLQEGVLFKVEKEAADRPANRIIEIRDRSRDAESPRIPA
jgi:hypothetical protein